MVFEISMKRCINTDKLFDNILLRFIVNQNGSFNDQLRVQRPAGNL